MRYFHKLLKLQLNFKVCEKQGKAYVNLTQNEYTSLGSLEFYLAFLNWRK